MVSVVPFGIWTNFLKFRKEKNKTPDHIRFLYVSNFYLYKRQLFLISVFEELISAGYDVSLTLCGDTYGHEIVLKQLTSSIIRTDRIKYIGKIPHKFIPEIYNNHDVLIFPSLIESFGIPFIEAQYFRLWILFSFQPAEEIMERNQYKRYKILGADMKRDLEQFIMKVQNGEITLENDIEAEKSTFKETTLKTMEYLEEFLETKKSEL
ncbi:MAG: glycosyltransferase [Ignavibacteriaceae bacterium]|nr:glycosyltransferase [Ignavibacteriaceae bacterium]